MPLTRGRYPVDAALQSFLGKTAATSNATAPVRSNLEFPVYSGALADTAASLTSGVLTAVPVPVDIGQVVTKISVLVGATPASTPTHSFAAIYSGTTVTSPPLIGQSTDGTTAVMAASTRFDFTLTTPTAISSTQAPNGFIYVGISVTGTAVPSLITTPAGAAAGQYRWMTNTPLYFSQTAGSALAGTAAATLINASTLTTAPVVLVW